LKTNNKGFTLAEILLVIAIIGIMLAVASPGLSRAIRNYNFSNDSRLMLAAINRARSQAIQSGLNTTVQFIPGPGNLSQTSYVAFFDDGAGVAAAAGNGVLNNGETIIQRGSFHDGITMAPPVFLANTLNNGNSMTFNGLGLPWGFNATGPIIYSGVIDSSMPIDSSTTRTMRIVISSGGRLSIVKI
jgi:prepilin-type N-terminal cleavage/methylation domain-containing protein